MQVSVAISCVVWKNIVRRWEYLEMDETCKFDHNFFFTVDVMLHMAHPTCPRILFLDTCLVCVSFTCLTCVWHVTWMLLSLSDSEESIFSELGHSMNWIQKKGKTYINNKTKCSGYSCHSLKWGSDVYFFIGIFGAFIMDVWNKNF